MSDLDLRRIGYEAYAKQTGGKTFDGREMPAYDDLPKNVLAAWSASADAIRDAILSATKVVDDQVAATEPAAVPESPATE